MISRENLRVRDPYIVCTNGKYYLIHSNYTVDGAPLGVSARVSTDLENFSDPYPIFTPPENFWATRDFWAPEVHQYKGKWYLFLSLKSETHRRATQIFVADEFCPEKGMNFVPVSAEPATPAEWECLDGTLWVEDGVPYIVFCHEWLQCGDGEICAMALTDDLSAPAGEPFLLFCASAAVNFSRQPFYSDRNGRSDNRVTDGCFFHKMQSGALAMLWSTGGRPTPDAPGRYVLAAAISPSGRLAGPWHHDHPLLFIDNGGHGMIFTDAEGRYRACLHAPNSKTERMRHFFLKEENGTLSLV